MSQDLLARAEAFRAKYAAYEQVPGTPYHKDTRDPAHAHLGAGARLIAPNPPLSTHVVAFYDWADMEEVHFVGPDAERVFDALEDWMRKPKGDPFNLPGTDKKLLYKIIPRTKMLEVDGLPRLTFRLSEWNDVVKALQDMGIGLSGAPMIHDGEPTTP